MIKHELLSPAGDMESLYQAIANGADAVYLGCKLFGARKYAKNFDNDEIIEAINYAHLYGVKVYVTMNTLVKDSEVESFLNQVEFLHKHGVDAILIQDFGMLCLVRKMYPNLEVHASTQANVSSQQAAELFYKLGVKRIVFPREMTLEEINSITVPIEKEVFIHGALCICYSGCCLMSSMLGTRSGNRGECAGSCRLPYRLKTPNKNVEGNYILSTKELNTSPKIDELLKSNVTSFKIEGRMKSPEYVGFITNYYRHLLDKDNLDLERKTEKLKTIFNRGFTTGNLFSSSVDSLMNRKTPNHIGLEIGKVIKTTPTRIKLKLNRPLNQYDAIRFMNSGKGFIVNFLYDEHDNLISSAKDICYVDNKIDLKENDIVCKTQDHLLLEELKLLPERKVPITIKAVAKVGENLLITISDQTTTITVQGSVVEKSLNSPISEERIKSQLEKLGNTPFISTNTEIIKDPEIFISIKELNALRRKGIEELTSARMTPHVKFEKKEVIFKSLPVSEERGLTAAVTNEEQLKTCLELGLNYIYISDDALYEKYKDNKKVFYKVPRCQVNPLPSLKERNLTSDYLDFSSKDFRGDYSLNITNIYSLYYLYQMNIKSLTLSVELTSKEVLDLLENYEKVFHTKASVETVAYGRTENMIIKGNILSLEKDTYNSLIDLKNRSFPVLYDGVNTHIFNYENTSLDNVETIKKYSSIRLNFLTENKEEVKKVVNMYRS